MNLRQITQKDQIDLKKIYFDSINSIDETIYSKEQKLAWSSQAWENPEFDKTIIEGKGWVIYETNILLGFALRFPNNRLSLLYCRGQSMRKGYGTSLLNKIESDAIKEGINFLETEASLISYKMLIKNNWEIIRKEKIIIKDSFFDRYKMIKNFN